MVEPKARANLKEGTAGSAMMIRYGLIGCGMMGQEHVRNLSLISTASVVAIFEPDASMLEASLALLPSAVTCASLEELLAREDFDALVITSPNFCHAGQLRAISTTMLQKQGARPCAILCEKPLCTNLDDVAALRALPVHFVSSIWTAMEYRYMPAIAELVRAAHSEVDTGGTTMLSIREHRFPFLTKVGDWNRFSCNTGGTLVEKCCHFFDLMRLVMRADPVRLYASGGVNHNHLEERYGPTCETPDILDNAFVVLDFPLNRRAVLDLCMFAEGSRFQEEICVVGPRGKIECKVPGPGRFWPAHLGPAPTAVLVYSPRQPAGPREELVPVDEALLSAGDHNGSTFYQHLRFNAAAALMVAGGGDCGGDGNGGGRMEVTFEDGLKAVIIGLAAEESARTGLAIDLTQGPFMLR